VLSRRDICLCLRQLMIIHGGHVNTCSRSAAGTFVYACVSRLEFMAAMFNTCLKVSGPLAPALFELLWDKYCALRLSNCLPSHTTAQYGDRFTYSLVRSIGWGPRRCKYSVLCIYICFLEVKNLQSKRRWDFLKWFVLFLFVFVLDIHV
jgi:hypothetical protein